MNLISQEIIDYLDTKEGGNFFIKISNSKTYQQYYDRKKAFCDPPYVVTNFFRILEELEKEVLKINRNNS